MDDMYACAPEGTHSFGSIRVRNAMDVRRETQDSTKRWIMDQHSWSGRTRIMNDDSVPHHVLPKKRR